MISLQADVDADADSALNLIRIRRQGEGKKKRERKEIYTRWYESGLCRKMIHMLNCVKKSKKKLRPFCFAPVGSEGGCINQKD